MPAEGTSETLLRRMGDLHDHAAWERFCRLYTPLILCFSRERGCTPTMAQDVLQETLVCLMRQLPAFAYDPERGKFRSLLFRIVQGRIRDRQRRDCRRQAALSGAQGVQVAAALHPTADNGYGEMAARWEQQWRRNLVRHAIVRVRLKVQSRTFRSFEDTMIHGRPIQDVARELGISRNVVYQHRARVVRLIRDEVKNLQEEVEDLQ